MSRLSIALGLTAALAFGQAAMADNAKPDTDSCLRIASINNFKVLDEHTLILTEGVNHDFKVTVAQNTRRLKHIQVLKAEGRGSSCLGPGDRLSAVDDMRGFDEWVTVTAVEYMPAEAASDQ